MRLRLPLETPGCLGRQLEESGVLTRRRTLPPASGLVYELTVHGRDLEPVLLALGRWGSPLQPRPESASELSPDALVVALRTTFDPDAAADLTTRRFGYGRSLLTTMLIGNSAPLALAFSAAGSPSALALYASALVLSGVGIGIANSQAVTVRQLATPAEMHGRVNGAHRFLSWGMLALGATAAGIIASAWGAFPTIIVGAIGTTIATAWIIASPVRTLRNLDDTPT